MLTEAGTIAFTIEKLGSKKRYKALKGSFTQAAKVGVNRLKFKGRLGKKVLVPGRYRLVTVAREAAGNACAVKRTSFTVLR